MDAVVVTKQENVGEVTALLKLKHGRNRSIWMKLPAMEVAVVGTGYALIVMDTVLDY